MNAPKWEDFMALRPCCAAVAECRRRWPDWESGTPPELALVLRAEGHNDWVRWLIVRLLQRKELLFWAADCAERSLRHCDEDTARHQLGVLNEVRRCAATGEYLSAEIRAAAYAAAYAAYAAAYAAAAASADAAYAAYAYAAAAYAAAAYAAEHREQVSLALFYLGVDDAA